MMSVRAAIYARRSKEQKDRAEEAKSVTRQVEGARALAAKQGWTVAEEHIFIDDGISGTEFQLRPGLQQLLGLLHPHAPFQRLIVEERKAIGREQFETGMIIKQLAQAGVEIVDVDGRSLTPRNPVDKLMSSVQGYSDEDHFVKTSERMHRAHERFARRGHVTGGRKFGYRNRPVYKGEDSQGNPLKSHVERVVDPAEASAVLRACVLYDSGLGYRAVAKQLNSEGVVAPLPFHRKKKLGGEMPIRRWECAHVRAILTSEIYSGVIVWNQSRGRDDYGQRRPRRREEKEVVRVVREDLRIVPQDLWNRVQARRRDVEGRAVRFDSGRLSGRPPKDAVPNLLVGISTCGVCGGGLGVDKGGRPHQRRPVYICYQRHRSGEVGCRNTLRVPVDEMNEAVLQAIEEHALTPEAIDQVIQLSERDDVAEQQARLEREAKDVAKRIERLVEAIAGGDAPSPILAKLRALEARQREIRKEQFVLRPVPRLAPAVVEDRLAEWRRLLRSSTTQGRAVLQRIIRGRIIWTPRADGEGYDFVAETRFDKLFTGVAVGLPLPPWVEFKDREAAGLGNIGPEDTLDADYGRLLERAAAKAAKLSDPLGSERLPAGSGKASRPLRVDTPFAPFALVGSVRVA